MRWPASGAGRRRQAEFGAVGPVPRIPAIPAEAWLSDGQRVLHFRALIWGRWTQALEVTSGQLLPDQEVPLQSDGHGSAANRRSGSGNSDGPRVGRHVLRSGSRHCPTARSKVRSDTAIPFSLASSWRTKSALPL